ncbi:MAG: nuclear transport factor 2 family protein [Alphaproteobacteria bacterium]
MRHLPMLAASAVLAAHVAGPAAAADNIATVTAIYAAFGAGDVPAILAELADDVEWDYGHEGTAVPILVPRHGPAEVAAFFESLAGVEFRKFAILNMLEGGDQVAVVVDFDLVVRATGRAVADQEMHLWTFGADGKVTHFRHFVDTEAFAAAFAD